MLAKHRLQYKLFFYNLCLVLLLALMEALLELAAWGVQTCSSSGGAGRAAVSQTRNLSGNVRHRGGARLFLQPFVFCTFHVDPSAWEEAGGALLWFVTDRMPGLCGPSCPVCELSGLAAHVGRLLFIFSWGVQVMFRSSSPF